MVLTHIVCSPEVANILEFTAGFRANVTADADRGDIGAVKLVLSRKFDVIVDPYFPRNSKSYSAKKEEESQEQ